MQIRLCSQQPTSIIIHPGLTDAIRGWYVCFKVMAILAGSSYLLFGSLPNLSEMAELSHIQESECVF